MKHGWEHKKLGEVCTIERGGSPRPISEFITDDPNGINWIKIGDAVEGSKYINETKEKIRVEGMKKSRFVHKGDFILSNSMSFGKPYILGVDGCIHDGWLVIHDYNNTFNKDYLYYFLSSPVMRQKFESLAVGGVVNNLNSKLVRGVSVAIPPLPVQEQVCSLLDKMNRVIEAKKEQLKELDTLAQAIFYDMFGAPVTNEKGWETSTIDTISTEKLSYGSGASAVEYDGQTRYIRITDINDHGDLNEDVKSPSEIDDKYLLKEGDILFARSGATVGKTYCHNEKNGRCIYAGYLIKMRPNTSKVLPKYIFYYTKSEYYKAFIRNAQNAVAQPNINAKQYGALIIPIPPLPLQQAFAEKVEAIERQKELINQSLREVQTLFDSRMDYWFSEENDDFGQLDKLD